MTPISQLKKSRKWGVLKMAVEEVVTCTIFFGRYLPEILWNERIPGLRPVSRPVTYQPSKVPTKSVCLPPRNHLCFFTSSTSSIICSYFSNYNDLAIIQLPTTPTQTSSFARKALYTATVIYGKNLRLVLGVLQVLLFTCPTNVLSLHSTQYVQMLGHSFKYYMYRTDKSICNKM